MKKILLLAVLAASLWACSKRTGQYNVYLTPGERKALTRAVIDSVRAEFWIDTLAKAHKGLSKRRTVTRVDTVYQPAQQKAEEKDARVTYSPDEVARMRKELESRIWTVVDSMKMNLADRDGFTKTIAREAIPILEKGKPNTDTVAIDVGHCHFRAYMHKGKMVVEAAQDRTATEVHQKIHEQTIAPAPNCPPPPGWFSFWQTYVSLFFNACIVYWIVRAVIANVGK